MSGASMMNGAIGTLLGFLRDSRGNVLPLAALAMVLSAAIVGGGVDMSRAYRAQNRLQSACDAAALAGRRAVTTNGFANNGPEQAQANSYFDTNFNQGSMEATGTTRTFSSSDNGQTVKGVASTSVNLAVMKIFGFPKFSLSAECQASMGVGNSDVMMVLDTTGSMGYSLGSGTRISALRTAMKNFYTTVKNATAGTNSRIRYGFVPFSTTVNVGQLLRDEDPSYLVDTYRIQSREPVYKWETATSTTQSEYKNESYTTPVQYGTGSWNKQSNCNNNLPSDTGWQSNGAATTTTTTNNTDWQQQTTTTIVQPEKATFYTCQKTGSDWHAYSYQGTRDLYTYNTTTSNKVFDYWTYKERSDLDYTSYKAFQAVTTNTGSNGSDVTSTWAGCIEERGTVSESSFSYSSTSGITPSGANDLDLDSAPTADASTKWAPMWPEVAYYRKTSGGSLTNTPTSKYGSKASSYCPYRAQLFAEMSQAQFNAYADALYPDGSTYLDTGLTWGGRLSSPTGIFQDNVNVAPSNGGEVSRHLIFMSDGDMDTSNTIQTSWGIEYHDRRVTDDGSSNNDSRHISRFQALCDAIKAKGIRIWTISFTTGSSSVLTTCASPNSAYNADDATELNAAFQEIANQVGELRIIQ